MSRGRGLLTPRARGVPPTGYRPPPPPPTQETYGEYVSKGGSLGDQIDPVQILCHGHVLWFPSSA